MCVCQFFNRADVVVTFSILASYLCVCVWECFIIEMWWWRVHFSQSYLYVCVCFTTEMWLWHDHFSQLCVCVCVCVRVHACVCACVCEFYYGADVVLTHPFQPRSSVHGCRMCGESVYYWSEQMQFWCVHFSPDHLCQCACIQNVWRKCM